MIIDDPSIPSETRIYYSKEIPVVRMGVLWAAVVLGIWFLVFEEGFNNKGLGLILCVLAGVFLYTDYDNLSNKEVQLLITDEGMQTPDTDFCTWEHISDERVTEESVKGNTNYYLNYQHKRNSERMLISNLDAAPKEIERLISIHKQRSEK